VSAHQFEREVERAQRAYDDYDAAGRQETLWAPFNELESDYRSRQLVAIAALMRHAGRSDLRGVRVLDVGCGRGRQLRGFLDMGSRPEDLVGIDVHTASLEVARSLSPQLRFDSFNGWEIPYADESFDLVTQFVVFSSIALGDLRRQLAREVVRVLRPGGHVLWWDTLHLAVRGQESHELEVSSLFPGLPRHELRIARRPQLGECLRLPPRARRFVAPFLNSLPAVNYPETHLAALIGPRK